MKKKKEKNQQYFLWALATHKKHGPNIEPNWTKLKPKN